MFSKLNGSMNPNNSLATVPQMDNNLQSITPTATEKDANSAVNDPNWSTQINSKFNNSTNLMPRSSNNCSSGLYDLNSLCTTSGHNMLSTTSSDPFGLTSSGHQKPFYYSSQFPGSLRGFPI